jgi:hypothetical protein
MANLLRERRVSRDYSRGWSHSIGEIFAEDYAQLHVGFAYKIRWLGAPGADVLAALRRDLPGAPAEPAQAPPLVIVRRGTIAPGEARSLPFGLLGPGRHVTFSAQLTGAARAPVRARLELRCGARSFARSVAPGTGTATIDSRDLGPARCLAALRSTASSPQRYSVRLRLAIER